MLLGVFLASHPVTSFLNFVFSESDNMTLLIKSHSFHNVCEYIILFTELQKHIWGSLREDHRIHLAVKSKTADNEVK